MNIKKIAIFIMVALCSCCFAENKSAYQLACIDAGKVINNTDSRIQQYDKHLKKISKLFNVTEKEIGDMTFVMTKRLKERKIKTSIIEMLAAMSQQSEAAELGLSYSESIALLASFMEPKKSN